MARAIRWTVPFTSFNGTSCHVDIYDEGWEGEVTTLTGATSPFEYEEDNDSDLLNTVIRYRTGYLKLIEENYGDLNDLYPLLNTDRYIEFYYGDALDFNGFIQAQEFEQPWQPGPRVVSLPVISPLGLAASTFFDWTDFNPPRWTSIETLINKCLSLVQGDYEGYYFPHILSISEPLTTNVFVNSLTFCPFGSEYDKTSDLTGIYKPMAVSDALKNVCTWMGCVLHDVPGYVIFQRLDFTGQYIKRKDISAPFFTPTLVNLTNIATVASNSNNKSTVMPLSKIDVTFEGSEDIPDMNFSRCRGYAGGCNVEGKEFCANTPVISDFEGTFGSPGYVGTGGALDKNSIYLGAYGSGSLKEMLMFRPGDNWGTRKFVASYKIFEWDGTTITIGFDFKYGSGLENLNNPSAQPVAVIVKCGDYYWSGQQRRWLLTSGLTSQYSFNWVDGRDYCEFTVGGNGNLRTGYPLVVEFYAPDNSSSYTFTISNVMVKKYENATSAYLNQNKYWSQYTVNGSPSTAEGSVKRGYSVNIYTLNRIRLNYAIINTGSLENQIVDAENLRYPYLMVSQDRLTVDVKMSRQDNSILYLDKFQIWGSTGKWRVIAYSFDPWNDIYNLTLHHSPTFDS